METFTSALNIVLIICGLIVALGAAVAFFRVNLAKSQIEALRGDRDDLDKRVKRQDEEIDSLKKRGSSQDSVIRAQNEKIKVLERVVTGKEQLDHLQRQLDAHDKRIDERHKSISENFTEVLHSLNSTKEALETLNESNREIQTALLLYLRGQEKK